MGEAAIPLEWIKHYVDRLLETAEKFQEGPMRDAALLRAEHAMDMVAAWKEYEQLPKRVA